MYRIIGADGTEYGPISADMLRAWIAQGRANAHTLARAENATQWRPLSHFPEFVPTLAAAPAPLPPLAPVSLPPPRQTNSLALTGMIMGLFSFTCGFCCCYGFPFNLLGIILSLAALAQIRNDPFPQQGKGMAIAGLVLSLLSIVWAVAFLTLGLCLNLPDIMRELRKL
jgi:hypothetical protein